QRGRPLCYTLIQLKRKVVVVCRAPRQLPRRRRDRKQGRKRFDVDGLPVGQEFQIPQPSVSPIAVPSATQRLGVEYHLMYLLASGIRIRTETDMPQHIIGLPDVAAEYQLDILRRLHQLLPDGSP